MLTHQQSTKKSTGIYLEQNPKPRFSAVHLEESLKPFAEDVTSENQQEKLSNLMLPLRNYPYDKQLEIKKDIVEQSFDQINRAILWDRRIDDRVWKYVEFREGNFCKVEPIIPSPLIEHYRSKDEFSCGRGVDGQKTVGFYIGPRNHKQVPGAVCVPPLNMKSMKPKHVLAVKHFDQFIKQHRLPVCESTNVLKKDQYWRTLTLKSNEQNDLMMIVVTHPQSLSKNEIDGLKQDLVDYFINGLGRECDLNSLYFQACSQLRCTSEENPLELIYGNECIYEIYNERKIRILPESPMQVNKKATEILYRSILEQAQLDENTVVLDIGSSFGVFSILASSLVRKVYAIDPSILYLEEGKFNAKLNGCQNNIEWIGGVIELHLHRTLKKISDLHGDHASIVAVVNPLRYSLSTKTITMLRSITSLKRILYVSNKMDEQMMHNFHELATSERTTVKKTGSPIIPTSIHPMDLLPHTLFAEIVVNCVRL